jgi:hypothetical protein
MGKEDAELEERREEEEEMVAACDRQPSGGHICVFSLAKSRRGVLL